MQSIYKQSSIKPLISTYKVNPHISGKLPSLHFVSSVLLKAMIVFKHTHAQCLVWVAHWVLKRQTGICNLSSAIKVRRISQKEWNRERNATVCCFSSKRSWNKKMTPLCTKWRWHFNLKCRTRLVPELSTWQSARMQQTGTSQAARILQEVSTIT